MKIKKRSLTLQVDGGGKDRVAMDLLRPGGHHGARRGVGPVVRVSVRVASVMGP